jgi:hypothetical protein
MVFLQCNAMSGLGVDFASAFEGYWKRNMTWRLFGGDFRVLKSSSNIIFIEQASNMVSFFLSFILLPYHEILKAE